MFTSPDESIAPPQPTAGVGSQSHIETTGELPAKVAVICDFREENWPSMDLVGDMLCLHLQKEQKHTLVPSQIRPVFRSRLLRLPISPQLCRNTDRLINRFVDYPLHLRKESRRFDIFHLVDHSYSHLLHYLPQSRTVVTCHDLDTFRCLLDPERDQRPLWFRAMTRRILNGFKLASHVIAVSSATRELLLSNRLFSPDRISVVPNGVHPACSPLPDPIADEQVARLLKSECQNPIWLLNVGSTVERKRIDVLLRTFAAIQKELPQARLIRVGGPFNRTQLALVKELQLDGGILVLPFLERNVLAAIYRQAALLLHTADAEGFGLPLIEAMACGCPVVASDIQVLREVGGRSVTFCPVADAPCWSRTVVRLVLEKRNESDKWGARRQEAISHAAHFTWTVNARHTELIYQDLLRESRIGSAEKVVLTPGGPTY